MFTAHFLSISMFNILILQFILNIFGHCCETSVLDPVMCFPHSLRIKELISQHPKVLQQGVFNTIQVQELFLSKSAALAKSVDLFWQQPASNVDADLEKTGPLSSIQNNLRIGTSIEVNI